MRQPSAAAACSTPCRRTLSLIALNGNVDIGRTLVTSPSPTGNLRRVCESERHGGARALRRGRQLILSDADPSSLPSAAAPFNRDQHLRRHRGGAERRALPDQHAATPIYAAADAAGTLQPVRIVALNGSVDFPPNPSAAARGHLVGEAGADRRRPGRRRPRSRRAESERVGRDLDRRRRQHHLPPAARGQRAGAGGHQRHRRRRTRRSCS